jgi:hypothetical protein
MLSDLLGEQRAAVDLPPPVEVTVEPDPEPLPVIVPAPPNYGNIRPLLGEDEDPEEFGPLIHEFPEMSTAATRFEDFNRRLFVYEPGTLPSPEWPETTADDFPTLLTGFAGMVLTKAIRQHLRPRYPVIIDTYGWWAASSRLLEMNPDATNAVIASYLAVPEAKRPVVVSARAGSEKGVLAVMRYGFVDFKIPAASLAPQTERTLANLFNALITGRETWMWFSVARMRHDVTSDIKIEDAARKALQSLTYMEEEIARVKADGNRFVELFKSRVPLRDRPVQEPDEKPEEAQLAADAAAAEVARAVETEAPEEATP